jgi:hypothetical protein
MFNLLPSLFSVPTTCLLNLPLFIAMISSPVEVLSPQCKLDYPILTDYRLMYSSPHPKIQFTNSSQIWLHIEIPGKHLRTHQCQRSPLEILIYFVHVAIWALGVSIFRDRYVANNENFHKLHLFQGTFYFSVNIVIISVLSLYFQTGCCWSI